jgi:Uma2 family endonuclease
VTCDRPADQRSFLPEPRLIVEVLSHLTAAHDRGRKGEEYRQIRSVEAVLFVFSDERRVELWRREGERWVIEDYIGEAAARLDSLGIDLPLAAIYANITLD